MNLYQALSAAPTITFKQHAIIKVKGESRDEDAYTYVSEDETQGVQFRMHSLRAFTPVVLNRHNMSDKEVTKVINAWFQAGGDQHMFKGGFDEAIKVLRIKADTISATSSVRAFKVGDRVKYLAGGKVSRLEGVAGKWMPAVVEAINRDGCITVMPEHRTAANAAFKGMGAVCEVNSVRHA